MPHEHVKPCQGVGSRPTLPEDGSTAAGPLGLCFLVGILQPSPGVHFPAPLAPHACPGPVWWWGPAHGGEVLRGTSGTASPSWGTERLELTMLAPALQALRALPPGTQVCPWAPRAFLPQGTAAGLGSGLAGERVCELRVCCSSTHTGSGVSRCAQPFLCNLLKCHVV